MSSRKSAAAKKETPRPTGRRLRLLDHLSDGAFDDQNLQDASAKIARMSQNRGELEVSETAPSLDEITDSGTDSGTDLITDLETISPIQSPIQSPIDQSVTSPNQAPHIKSETSPNESPIQAPNEKTAKDISIPSSQNVSWEPVLLTENQATLYICLKQIQGAVTSLALIAQATKISEHTLKSALKKLREHGLIAYGGRKNSGGRFGFTAQAIERPILLRGDRARLQKQLHQIDVGSITFSTSLSGIEAASGELKTEIDQLELGSSHLMNHRLGHRLSDLPLSSSSSKNELLLQDLQNSLLVEQHFQDLDVRSLEPYLDNFETLESLQTFLDIANAVVTAAQGSKPIQNPKGFLFAQLKAGFINPPLNFKSRRVQAQEARNAQLETELSELRRLQEEEAKMRFELFKEGLTQERRAELEAVVAERVKPGGPVSRERQMEVYRDEVLQEWFEQERGG